MVLVLRTTWRVFPVILLGCVYGCRAGAPTGQAPVLTVSASLEVAQAAHVAAHEPGSCPLCDLYQKAREHVVRIRTSLRQGAGIVVTESGWILTSRHVVGDEDLFLVETHGGAVFPARTLKLDEQRGLAIVEAVTRGYHWRP